jgi:hypothetical protein
MIDELTTRQIAALLRDGCTVDEIASQLGVEEALVKLVGARVGTIEDRDIDDNELRVLRKHAYNLAVGASDDATQARMTMFLLERDRPSKKVMESSPIAVINNAIIAANGAFEKLCQEMSTPKPLNEKVIS